MKKEKWEDKKLFQTNTEEEREQLLSDNAVDKEQMEVRRTFTADEMVEFKDEHAKLSIELRDEEIKKKIFMDDHNAKVKPLKHDNQILVKNLKDGFIDEHKNVWALDNQEDNVMEFYDINGKCVMQRALHQHERQLKLIPRTGTNEG